VYKSRRDIQGNSLSVPTNNTVNSNAIDNNGIYGVYRLDALNNPVARRPARFANQFAGNRINVEDFIPTINSNTTLPSPKSRFAHPKQPKTVPVKRVPRAKLHVVVPKHNPKAATSAVARPRIPALFRHGVNTIAVTHVPIHPHR
jgi:hypothetical protein